VQFLLSYKLVSLIVKKCAVPIREFVLFFLILVGYRSVDWGVKG